MAIRFAGSRSGNPPSFSPTGLQSSRVTTGAGAAADAVSVGNVFGSLRAKSPKYDEIGSTAEDIRTAENIAGMEAEANLQAAGMRAYGSAARSKLTADYYDKMAAQAEQAGTMSMIGGIAGGAMSLLTGGLM